MAPQLLGVQGRSPDLEYSENAHELGKLEWTETELKKEYEELGDYFYPVSDIPCCCYLKKDGTRAMVLMVSELNQLGGEISFYTVIDLKLQVVDNINDNAEYSEDISEASILKVTGVIATEYRDEGIYSGKRLALELYSRIINHDSRPLCSDNEQFKPGQRTWELLPEKILKDNFSADVNILQYSSLYLLKQADKDITKYQFQEGLIVNYVPTNQDLEKEIWGVEDRFNDILLIARK